MFCRLGTFLGSEADKPAIRVLPYRYAAFASAIRAQSCTMGGGRYGRVFFSLITKITDKHPPQAEVHIYITDPQWSS
jgi:hypothetical protein